MKTLTLFLVLVALGVGLYTTPAMGGTAGKIAGRVTDVQTGEPLPGANVIIEGTTLGAATDGTGAYAILNVPPGVYTVKASMIGFQDVRIQNVKVSIDLTTTVDFKLSETVLEVAQPVTVTAERPVVQMDMTSSLAAVGAEEIQSLPVQEVSDVLRLQAGLVTDPFGGLHFRGGRSGEVAYWIDGVAATDVYSGNLGVEVENVSIQELQVVSGTFNAEYGQAMSGIINIVTKEGGATYNGEIKTYVGDYVTSRSYKSGKDSLFLHLDDLDPLAVENYQANLSGPVPFTQGKFTFFAMARYFNNEGWLYGRRYHTPQGLPGDSSFVPMNPFKKISLQDKISYRLSPSMKLSYELFWNQNQFRNFDHYFKYNPDGDFQRFENGYTHIVSWNHVLSPTTFYEARLTKFYTDYQHYVYENPLARPNYILDPADTTRTMWIVNSKNPGTGYVHADSMRAPTSFSFARAGTKLQHFSRSTSSVVGKLDLTSQVTRSHQLKGGAEVRFHKLTLDDFTIQPRRVGGEEVRPFEPWVPPLSTPYHYAYAHKPTEFSAYVQDKIELKDMIVNMGLRYDFFDADGVVPADPADPNIYDPLKPENIYRNPNLPDSLLNLESNLYTPEERRAFMHKKVDPKMQLSPRLGVAYPITDRGVIHFSYGHFFQIPLFEFLYSSPDFKVSKISGLMVVGNADLKPQRTVMYEIGLQQQLTEDIGVDVTLFYRDVRDWVGTSPLISTPIPSVKYAKYENKDYSNVRGITLTLNKRYSNYFSASVDYSYMIAEGTYSNPTDAFNDLLAKKEPRLQLIPLAWDQRHTLNGSVSVGTASWRVSLIGRFWTGKPYTPVIPRGELVGATAYSGLRDNSERLPSINTFDAHFFKQFNYGRLNFSVFANIYNLFDRKNATWVYTDTGSPAYTLETRGVHPDPRRISTVEDYIIHPEWYTEPRQVHIGLAVGF